MTAPVIDCSRRPRGVAGVMLALAATIVALGMLADLHPRTRMAHAQQVPADDDPALLRELAERLLIPPYPGPPGVELPPARLLPGTLPTDQALVALVLPLPPNVRVIGSAVRPTLSGGGGPMAPVVSESIEIVLDAADPPAAVLAFYDRAFRARGLVTPTFDPGGAPGGFLPAVDARGPTFYCQSDRGPFVEVAAVARTDRPTDVRLRVHDFPGPCSPPPGPPSLPGHPVTGPPPDPLPPLTAPVGVAIFPVGGGGSPFQRTSDAVAVTELSAVDLEAHYARQLAAAGWQRTAGGTSGPLAWSVWQVPEDDAGAGGAGFSLAPGAREGFLAVVEGPGATLRTLHVQVTSAGAAGAGPDGFPPPIAIPAEPPSPPR